MSSCDEMNTNERGARAHSEDSIIFSNDDASREPSPAPRYATTLPEWVPDEAGSEFASRVMGGVDDAHDGLSASSPAPKVAVLKRRHLTLDDYVKGIASGDRMVLSRAITLVESNAPAHFEMAQLVMREVLHRTGKSVRVGITGVPGAGKSTFIE